MLLPLLRTFLIYIAVIIAMRLMGKRQLGELQPAELVTTFLISNVASICIDEPELPLLSSLVPIFLIAAMEILSSSIACRSPAYSRLLFGKPITVIRNGAIDQRALAKMRISAVDLMEALRGKDVFSPADVAWGVIETNGSLSLTQKPAPKDPMPMLPLLIDRHIYSDNLAAFSRDIAWLESELKKAGTTLPEVLIFLYNGTESALITKSSSRKNVQKGSPA